MADAPTGQHITLRILIAVPHQQDMPVSRQNHRLGAMNIWLGKAPP